MVDLVKEIQTKFMQMTSQFSSLFKHIQQLHTQFSENEKMKIRRSSHLEQISIKWAEYKGQIKQLEKKKEYLSKVVELRSDELIKQKYKQRLLIMKILKLEEMIKGFLGGSYKLIGKQLSLPAGEKLQLNENIVILETPVDFQTKTNIFTKSLFFVTTKIYEVIHSFVNFNVDFETHKEFLKLIEEEMKKEWKEINTEDKCTIEFEHRKIKSAVDQFSQLQDSIRQQINSLKIDPLANHDYDHEENWGEMGRLLETIEGKISQKTKIKNNYEKIIREERLMVDRILKTAEPKSKLWDLCNKHKQKLLTQDISNQQQQFEELIYEYTKCFNDLIKNSDHENEANPNYLKMIVFHQTNLISSLHSDIMRIQVGIQSKKKIIQDGLREIFSQLYNQIHNQQASYRTNRSQRMDRLDRTRNDRTGDVNMTHIASGGGGNHYEPTHQRNRSNVPSSAERMNNHNDSSMSILAQLSDTKPPDFSKKQASADEKKMAFKKLTKKSSIKVTNGEKKESGEIVGSGEIEKQKVESSKIEISEPIIQVSCQSFEHIIKFSLQKKNEKELEETMKKYMEIVNKTIEESKQIESNMNKMLEFVKNTFSEDSKYFEPFKELGYTTDAGPFKFIYLIPFEINIIHPSIHHQVEIGESMIRQQPTYKELEISKSMISKVNEPEKCYATIQIQTYLEFIDIAVQTENQFKIYTSVRPIQIQISPVYTKEIKITVEPVVETGIQKSQKQQHHQAFALNEKIRMSTELIERKQQIMDLKVYKQRYQNLQKQTDNYNILLVQHSKCEDQIQQQKDLCKQKQEALKEISTKLISLTNEKKFLQSQMKKQQQQKSQRIIRQQDYIRHVLASTPPTLDQKVSRQLQQKIITLMNKIISLEKSLSQNMDEMEVSTMKMTEDIENLKHLVCVRLNAKDGDGNSSKKDEEMMSSFVHNKSSNILKQNQSQKE